MANTEQPDTPNNSPAERKHDLFEDPALKRSFDEDPVARFIVSNWKNLIVVILAAIGTFYLRNQVQSTTDVRVEESSETFDRARSSVLKLIENQQKDLSKKPSDSNKKQENPDKEEIEKWSRSAKDSLIALKSGPEPYASMVPFYEQLLNRVESVDNKNSIAGIAWKDNSDLAKRLVLELQELTLARTLLDSDSTFKDGIVRLQNLARESNYVRAPAVLTLLRVVDSEEDKSTAVSLAQDVVKLFPEQSEKIEVELKRLSS